MPYTEPPLFVPDTILTAAQLNTYLRDNMIDLEGRVEIAEETPTTDLYQGSTQISISTDKSDGAKINGWYRWNFQYTVTNPNGASSGDRVLVTLPRSPDATTLQMLGTGHVYEAAGGTHRHVNFLFDSFDEVRMYISGTGTGGYGQFPARRLAVNDQIRGLLFYRTT